MPTNDVPRIKLPSGETIPKLGQGTWYLGEGQRSREEEIMALGRGLDLGLTLIDTAEMYGDGTSEELVGEAIAGRRDEVFLISKVLPSNATTGGVVAACERSLKRLGTDRIDLYLLHWRGPTALEQTLEGFAALIEDGKIRHWGVSNFDVADMEYLEELPRGADVQTNQILYNLTRRGVEWDLLPWARERSMPLIAYSPIEQGRMLNQPALQNVADGHGVTPAQVALAWLLRQDDIVPIPKAGTRRHVEENRAALDVDLTDQDLAALDSAFPPPKAKQPLEIL